MHSDGVERELDAGSLTNALLVCMLRCLSRAVMRSGDRYLRLIKAIRIVRSHELMGIICRADDASYKAGLLGLKVKKRPRNELAGTVVNVL